MAETKIEWTDATWNPVRGCTKVSPGCKYCYAETFAERWRGTPGHPYGQGFDLRLVPEKLGEPLRWKKPRRIFVNSMSDLFHEGVPDEYIAAVFGVMAAAPQHTFQVLTKRAERMRDLLSDDGSLGGGYRAWDWVMEHPSACGLWRTEDVRWPLPNVWLGVSAEDQERADERIPHLLATPAAVRFMSAEPLLGPIDLRPWLPSLDWVIVGGESGPKARPMDLAWARSIVEQCKAAGVACFVKQLGARPVAIPIRDGAEATGPGGDKWPPKPVRLRDPKGGDINDFPSDLQIREWPR